MTCLRYLLAVLSGLSTAVLAQTTAPADPVPTAGEGPRWQWSTSAGYHHYREPRPDMELQGPELGLHLRLSELPAWPRWQLEADLLGSLQRYDSPDGVLENVENIEGRGRLLYPVWTRSGSALFVGPAVQGFYNDLRGRTSRNFGGYERKNLGLWLVLQWRMPLASGALPALAGLQVDAGRLVRARHYSYLSQVNGQDPDVGHTQRHGRYVQARLDLRAHRLLVQPYVRHTAVKDSNVSQGFYEPQNDRWQAGVSVTWPAR